MSLISKNRPRNLEDRLPHGNTQMINYVVFKIVSETLSKAIFVVDSMNLQKLYY